MILSARARISVLASDSVVKISFFFFSFVQCWSRRHHGKVPINDLQKGTNSLQLDEVTMRPSRRKQLSASPLVCLLSSDEEDEEVRDRKPPAQETLISLLSDDEDDDDDENSRVEVWFVQARRNSPSRRRRATNGGGSAPSVARLPRSSSAGQSQQQQISDAELARRLQQEEDRFRKVLENQERKDASLAASLHYTEKERDARKHQEIESMKKSKEGRSVLLVEQVIRLVEAQPQPGIETVGKDDAVFLAERMLDQQEDFRQNGKPTHVSIGYHYTR